ncbi:uncharacterized protein LOC142100945 isoform X2 [Mixophyes fleayi]|uniref:uncharacterized protein LOC142100945 isoform X2 n=1 Tax=Mixophyes fleayi TaxID=3061075 RepID=UPI003F4E0349
MEDVSVAPCDESSSEDNTQSMNGETVGLAEDLYTKPLLLDVVNGCDLSAASNHLKPEENLQSEDVLNNNKVASEEVCFTIQRLVPSGDATAIKDHLSFADDRKELFFISSEDMEYKETLNPVRDLAHCSDKTKEQAGGQLYNGQSNQVLENHTIKSYTDDIECNSEISQDGQELEETHMETITARAELYDPCKVDLLTLKQSLEDKEESYTTEFSLYENPKEKDCLKVKNFKDKPLSKTLIEHNSELTMSDEAPVQIIGAPVRSPDLFEDISNNLHTQDCNETVYTANSHSDVKKFGIHLQNSQHDVTTGTHDIVSSIGHLDLLPISTRSFDFQTKHTGIFLSKSDGTRTSKMRKERQPPKGGRSGPHYEIETDSHELELSDKENLSEREESGDEDNIDNSLHYGSSRLDHRKERHQYVSDKLDPDVLHLLEMHLRKQQLVDIKEEGEEELLDLHINKEKSRSESFKVLRNIPPVLDMVLEEPELEHSGEMLEDGSKTSSDTDSDDGSSVCAMEMSLMESLQRDLLSRSSKIDKHEITTILQTSSPELSLESKSKQKAGALHRNDYNVKCEGLKLQSDGCLAQRRGPSDLQGIKVCSAKDGDLDSDFISECAAMGNIHDIGLQAECSTLDSGEGSPEQPATLNDTEDFITEKTSMGEPDRSYECESVDKGLNPDVHENGISDAVTTATLTGTTLNDSKEDACIGSETSVKSAINSGLPCPTFHGNLEPHDIIEPYLDGETSSLIQRSQQANSPCPSDGCDDITGSYSTEPRDGADKALGSEEIRLTDLAKDLQASVKSPNESILSEPSAEMSTLHLHLEEKIMAILEKAHAADCRSSHLQAEAELLWKESTELRNECKSLSKEAAELLSLFTQQSVVHRHPMKQSSHKTKAGGSLLSDTKPRNKETLSLSSKANPRSKKKGEEQLQLLSKKYDFLRQEAPEIMRELHVLQRDLKSLPPHHSKKAQRGLFTLIGSRTT